MPCLHPSSFPKMKLESFFALWPLQHGLIMTRREYKSFSRLLFIRNHSFVFQIRLLTCRVDVERDISIDFFMKIAVFQLRASIPGTAGGGRHGCLNNTSVSLLKSKLRSFRPCKKPTTHLVLWYQGTQLEKVARIILPSCLHGYSGSLRTLIQVLPQKPVDNTSIHMQMEDFPLQHHMFSHACAMTR